MTPKAFSDLQGPRRLVIFHQEQVRTVKESCLHWWGQQGHSGFGVGVRGAGFFSGVTLLLPYFQVSDMPNFIASNFKNMKIGVR